LRLGGGSRKPQLSRTRTALARSERPSERPAKALPQQGRSGKAQANEARGLAGGASDHPGLTIIISDIITETEPYF